MTIQDLELLAKKILVGVAVTAIPAVIVLGGLWATQHALQSTQVPSAATERKGRP